MATISNPTDPNKVVATTSNVAPQAAVAPPTSATNGQYSTLQKYLGANQGSGQRLASAIGNNLGAESKSLTDTTNRELSESDASNKRIGDLTGQTNVFTNKLSSANANATPAVSGGYDAAKYSSNLSGTQAAADIAANRSDLNSFRNIATGNTSDKLRVDSEAEAKQALAASQKAYTINKDRQSQLNNFNDRSTLLQNAINSKNQRAGLQNLDNALLSQDKSGKLNEVNTNLQTNTKNLQEYKNLADARSRDVQSLSSTQKASESGLNTRLIDMNKEQQADLEQRRLSINEAKAIQAQSLDNKFRKFKETGEVDDELFSNLELGNVRNVDAEAKRQLGIADPSKMTNPDLQPIRMFNAMDGYDKMSNAVNMDLLRRNALTGSEVANQQDIDRLGILQTLSGGNIQNDLKLSDFTGTQLGTSSLDDTINQQGQNFLDTMNNRIQVRAQGDARGGQSWYNADAFADSSVADMLYKDQIRKAYNTYNGRSEGGGVTGVLEQGEGSNLIGNPSEYVSGPDSAGDLSKNYSYLTAPITTSFGNRSGRNYAGYGSTGEAMDKAEDIAVGNIKSRLDQNLQNQGYQRLIKRMKQGT